ncbi:MAG: 4-hydroxythreonine-4-phosphate dehydrogenase PdxA [Pseudomonadota bacterium]
MKQQDFSALPIAVSCGDPSGIGPDIILAAYAQRNALQLPDFFVCGDAEQLRSRAAMLNLDVSISSINPAEVTNISSQTLPVMQLRNTLSEAPGRPHAANAKGVIEAIETAVEAVFEGHASAVVTAPIAKAVLYAEGFNFPGHTEMLAHLGEQKTGKATTPVMMIAGPDLKTVPVTIHTSLRQAVKDLTAARISETCRIVNDEMKAKFGVSKPRIAVAGLNPHAGEDGTIGREDEEIVRPACEHLRSEGINVTGPLPADTMFHAAARSTYDVAVCMYHDQALIPAKTLAFDEGVNVTLGLPFIRTSPDHGTAFELAGTGKARITSFVEALRLAAQLAQNSTTK